MPKCDPDGDQFSTLSVKNSLKDERARNLVLAYFIPLEIEIVVSRRYDSVMRPPVGFSSVYLDYLKIGFHIPLFPLLILISTIITLLLLN